MSLIPSVVSLDHIWPAEFTACHFLQQAERKEAAARRKCVRAKTHMETDWDVEQSVKYAVIHYAFIEITNCTIQLITCRFIYVECMIAFATSLLSCSVHHYLIILN